MRKTLLAALLIVAGAGGALAVPSMDSRKAMCEKYSDRYVWVEGAEACIPVNPCVSDVASIRNTYCNGTFADIGVKDYGAAEELVRQYVSGNFIVRKNPASDRYISVTQSGADALAVYNYRVFEFRDIGSDGQNMTDAFRGACLAYGGMYVDGDCVEPAASCDDLVALASFVYGGDVKIDAQYSDKSGCLLQK